MYTLPPRSEMTFPGLVSPARLTVVVTLPTVRPAPLINDVALESGWPMTSGATDPRETTRLMGVLGATAVPAAGTLADHNAGSYRSAVGRGHGDRQAYGRDCRGCRGLRLADHVRHKFQLRRNDHVHGRAQQENRACHRTGTN